VQKTHHNLKNNEGQGITPKALFVSLT